MMKSLSVSVLLFVLFFASFCVPAGSQNVPSAPMADHSAAASPTAPSETATPTATPTPEATATPTEFPLPAGTITDFAEKLKGSYELHWKGGALVLVDAATKQEVPQITFDKDGNWTRAYNLPNIEEKFIANGAMSDIKIDQDKLGIQDWEIVEGVWQRKTAPFATEVAGKTVELPLSSLEEVKFEILNNSSTNPSDRIDSNENGIKLTGQLFERKWINGSSVFCYKGMYEPAYTTRLYGNNFIAVPDESGVLIPKDTAVFIVVAIGQKGRYGLVGWIDANGIGQVRIVDKAGLNKPSNFSDWYLTHNP